MLIVLRIVFGLAAFWFARDAWRNAQANPMTGDLINAGTLAILLLVALANAAVWAPFFGERLSDPVTRVITTSTCVDRTNHLLRFLVWLEARGSRRAAVAVALLEGLHHPNQPAAFLIGLRNARPGSWMEGVYARELWRFDNLQNCSLAYRVLRQHGVDPRPHRNPEVNLALLAQDRPPAADTARLPLPSTAPAAPPPRNPRIQLFAGAEAIATPALASDDPTPNPLPSDAGTDRA